MFLLNIIPYYHILQWEYIVLQYQFELFECGFLSRE